MRHNNQLTEFT